jgi:hypothetical protein
MDYPVKPHFMSYIPNPEEPHSYSGKRYEVKDLTDKDIEKRIKKVNPSLIGIGSWSTKYMDREYILRKISFDPETGLITCIHLINPDLDFEERELNIIKVVRYELLHGWTLVEDMEPLIWTKESHKSFNKVTRERIKTVFLLHTRKTIISVLPKDVLFVLCNLV